MRVDGYKNLFDSYLDNKIFNQFVMLSPTGITHDEKLNILDEIAFRLQVEFQKQVILLTNITPEDILEEGHRSELTAYKGVMVSKSHAERDMFKINLLNMLDK